MAKAKSKKKISKALEPEKLKLNLGCGVHKMEGFKGVDISPDVKPDYCFDIRKTPWPFKDNSVDEVHCSHFLEHLDGMERISFFNELYRIMKAPYKDEDEVEIKSTARMITPAPFTHRYMQDPTHKFPMVVQEFYNYLSKDNRKAMGLEHYPLICDFQWMGKFHSDPAANLVGRNDEYIADKMRYNINILLDLDVTLTKI